MSHDAKQAGILKRYSWRTLVLMLAFTGILVAIDKIWDPSRNGWDAVTVWPLVLLTCLPLVLYGWEVVHYVRSIDEMLARFQVRAAAVAMLAMLLAAAILGVAEIYGAMEPINMTMMLPVAAVAHSVASMVQQVRVR
ncbi:hypothetical protein [Maricaulis sp.]|uniref:hypothetical protein n=1 Tax=Maricaulis sp. TaxID=1486257 RepID=UPI002602D107|nr:hypothetical protein [Maricaulis sp.]